MEITHEEIMEALVENGNSNMDKYVWAICAELELSEKENIRLKALVNEKERIIRILTTIIDDLIYKYEDRGE